MLAERVTASHLIDSLHGLIINVLAYSRLVKAAASNLHTGGVRIMEKFKYKFHY